MSIVGTVAVFVRPTPKLNLLDLVSRGQFFQYQSIFKLEICMIAHFVGIFVLIVIIMLLHTRW